MRQSTSIGFLPLLCLLFIALKLCGVIEWGWLWVLSPILIPFGLAALLILTGFIIAVVVALFSAK